MRSVVETSARTLAKGSVRAVMLFACLAPLHPTGHAQGCSACRDTTAGSAPQAREGLRRGTVLLGIPAGAIFLGIFALARRLDRDA